ncbi:unnamed protein product [Medioppia subpectinata]|uniref:Gustatory receptor n=1 Tax=Medioppia subpectinata TaxID=1979941 RepID=A0A7R9Q5K7_9ACAR|nr:unnamed protein product [Medioppia subpectinata]CAG2112396.1 unnamed protein product [Medioppia subpectinata]
MFKRKAKKPKVKISVSPDYPLPPELRQDNCGTHPYVRGLTSHRWADERRHPLHHPSMMFMTLFISFCRDIYGFMTPLDKQMATYVGDYPYFFHCKSQLNLAVINYSLMAMLTLIYYRYMYYKKRYPFPEAPIRLLAGTVTPRSVGLFDEAVIIEMCKSAKFWFHHTKTNTNLVGLAAFIICVFPVHFGVNDWSLFPIYFPWGVINAMGIRYVFNISHWTYTYFYLICFYHKARMKQTRLMINAQYVKYGRTTDQYVYQLINTFAGIYADIGKDNGRFFKTFSIIFLPLFMIFVDCLLFTEFFSEIPLVTRFVFGYLLWSGTFVILSYLRVVSSVAEEAKKAYKPLHKLQTTLKTNSKVCRYKKPKVKISVSPDYPLPPELRQDDCGTHPYVRGLTSHRWADERRHRLHHPRYPFPETPIRLMAGSVTPRSVGLVDEGVIIEMCKSAKFWFHHTKRNTNVIGLAAIIICVTPVHFGVNDWSMFPIYFPWGIINAMGIRYV